MIVDSSLLSGHPVEHSYIRYYCWRRPRGLTHFTYLQHNQIVLCHAYKACIYAYIQTVMRLQMQT